MTWGGDESAAGFSQQWGVLEARAVGGERSFSWGHSPPGGAPCGVSFSPPLAPTTYPGCSGRALALLSHGPPPATCALWVRRSQEALRQLGGRRQVTSVFPDPELGRCG